jgi:hypothetical protein
MIYIGIDPGVAGGIAMLNDAGEIVAAVKMPATEHDVFAFLCESLGEEPARAVLERVSSSPQMGVVSAFTFGRGYGALRMALTVAEIPFDEVSPRKWQPAMGCLSGGDKNITKRRAQALFPRVEITHALADSLLLAEFCRRIHTRSERTA